MLKFFRNIRRSLLSDNKTGKYLKYAIGEVILVMVGILLALQVNNWNEGRQLKGIEINLLHELKDGLNVDIGNLLWDSAVHFRSIQAANLLKNVFENDLPYNDSLAKKFSQIHYMTDFTPTKGAYESMKSIGVMTISNTKLRNTIIELVDRNYNLTIINNTNFNNYILESKSNVLTTHFDKFSSIGNYPKNPTGIDRIYGGEMIPNNFEKLKTNPAFIYHLNTLAVNHNIMRRLKTRLIRLVRELINDIEKEIMRLEGN
jgi:hypothetical protein